MARHQTTYRIGRHAIDNQDDGACVGGPRRKKPGSKFERLLDQFLERLPGVHEMVLSGDGRDFKFKRMVHVIDLFNMLTTDDRFKPVKAKSLNNQPVSEVFINVCIQAFGCVEKKQARQMQMLYKGGFEMQGHAAVLTKQQGDIYHKINKKPKQLEKILHVLRSAGVAQEDIERFEARIEAVRQSIDDINIRFGLRPVPALQPARPKANVKGKSAQRKRHKRQRELNR